MGRKATGTLARDGETFYAVIAIAKDKRRAFKLPTCKGDDRAAEARKTLLANWAERLRAAGKDAEVVSVMLDGATATNEDLPVIESLVVEATATTGLTVRDYVAGWPETESNGDRGRIEKHLLPFRLADGRTFGDVPIGLVTRSICKEWIAHLEANVGAARWHAYHSARKMFEHAVVNDDARGARILCSNPFDQAGAPSRPRETVEPGISGPDLTRLLACARVPVDRRILYAVAAYTGLRSGELGSLVRSDIEPSGSAIHVRGDGSKAGRLVEVPQVAVAVVQAARERCAYRVFGVGSSAAATLRSDMALASVSRGLERRDAFRRVNFDSLRSVFVAWSQAEWKPDSMVVREIGLRDLSAVVRRAPVALPKGEEPFPPIPEFWKSEAAE